MTKKKTIEEVESEIESFDGYYLLSMRYINNHSKLEILHWCGDVFMMSWNSFKQGQRCPKCSHKKQSLDRALPFEFVKEQIELGNEYELLSKEYIGVHSKLEILHKSCGDVFMMDWVHFNRGQRCPKCNPKNRSGENNSNWNFNLTDDHRKHGRALQNKELKEWKKAVFEHDDHTCQKCKVRGEKLEAHHILPWARFPELRFDVENGITLCQSCHKRYHKNCGYGERCNHKTMKTHLLYNHEL